MINFIKYQWIGFLALYWGLRCVEQKPLSQSLSDVLLMVLCCIVGMVLIAKIAKDVEIQNLATHFLSSTALSLLSVLLSQIAVVLWVFFEFDGIQTEYVMEYLIKTYLWQLIIAVVCLGYGVYSRQID